LWRLWAAFFAYAALAAVLLQKVLLPYVFPAWHAGDGLLVGGGDWLEFHRIALHQAAQIHALGWSAWTLYPEGQSPAGIAGAIYALTVPQPWTLIPLNAALHATAALVLLRIVQVFLPDWRLAVWAVLPFLLFPSALTWYGQIHKDTYSIAGAFLFVYGWIMLARLDTWRRGPWPPLRAALWVVLGAVLAWVVRFFFLEMLQGIGVALALFLSAVFVARGARGTLPWRRAVAAALSLWVLVIGMTPWTLATFGVMLALLVVALWLACGPAIRVPLPRTVAAPVLAWLLLGLGAALAQGSALAQTPPDPSAADLRPPMVWNRTSWLPAAVDAKLAYFNGARESFRYKHPVAAANIDADVGFHSAVELIAYVPRAAQIALLSPFPTQWLDSGKQEANTFGRRLAAAETAFVYLALIFLPYALWRWRRRVELWVACIFSGAMMLIYAMVTTNVGGLYRYRYGFLMIVVAISIAAALSAWQDWRARRSSPTLPPISRVG
jgi:hypothetical protein